MFLRTNRGGIESRVLIGYVKQKQEYQYCIFAAIDQSELLNYWNALSDHLCIKPDYYK